MENDKYESLHGLIQHHLNDEFCALPDNVRERVTREIIGHWDGWTPEQRSSIAIQHDMQHDPAHQVEYAAGWWIATMDANSWWLAESISPINAAMLLSRRNPNTEKIEDAESSSSDEMGPEDFRRLKNIFEGASDIPRTLNDWSEYAHQRSLKVHSWINEWKAWVQMDTNQAPMKSPAAPLPVSTPHPAPASEPTPAERRAKLDISGERGARRRILEKWTDIEMEYGPSADGRQVLRVLKRDKDENEVALKTIQNHLSALRTKGLIP